MSSVAPSTVRNTPRSNTIALASGTLPTTGQWTEPYELVRLAVAAVEDLGRGADRLAELGKRLDALREGAGALVSVGRKTLRKGE